MSSPLLHSPADIVRVLLVNLGLGANPPNSTWPVYSTNEPDIPDNCITVFDTVGKGDGRSMTDGELFDHYGIQVRVRATTFSVGYQKVNAIRVAFSESVIEEVVTISGTNYLVKSITQISQIFPLGKEVPTSRRTLFTVNALVTVKRV